MDINAVKCPECGFGFAGEASLQDHKSKGSCKVTILPSDWIERLARQKVRETGSQSERIWSEGYRIAILAYLDAYGVHPPVKE